MTNGFRWTTVPGLMVAALVVGAGPLAAQEPIATDRPGLGFGTSVVPRGHLQLELGLPAVELTREGTADRWLVNFPGLLRFGLTDHLEVRLGSPGLNLARVESGAVHETTVGFGPIEIGAKLGFAKGATGPELALIPSVILPAGDREFAGERASFTLNGVAAWMLPAELGLTTVAGLAVDPDGDSGHATSGAMVGVLDRSLNERVSGYLEAGWYPTRRTRGPVLAGVGAAVLLGRTVQVDAFVNRGLNDAAPDWIFGAGAAVRF